MLRSVFTACPEEETDQFEAQPHQQFAVILRSRRWCWVFIFSVIAGLELLRCSLTGLLGMLSLLSAKLQKSTSSIMLSRRRAACEMLRVTVLPIARLVQALHGTHSSVSAFLEIKSQRAFPIGKCAMPKNAFTRGYKSQNAFTIGKCAMPKNAFTRSGWQNDLTFFSFTALTLHSILFDLAQHRKHVLHFRNV